MHVARTYACVMLGNLMLRKFALRCSALPDAPSLLQVSGDFVIVPLVKTYHP